MAVPYSEGSPVATAPTFNRTFNLSDQLTCCDGSIIKVIEINHSTFLGDDGITRYDRDHPLGRGRVTGTRSWPPHPKSIASGHPLRHPQHVVAALASCPTFTHKISYIGGKCVYDSDALMQQVCENLDTIFEQLHQEGELT